MLCDFLLLHESSSGIQGRQVQRRIFVQELCAVHWQTQYPISFKAIQYVRGIRPSNSKKKHSEKRSDMVHWHITVLIFLLGFQHSCIEYKDVYIRCSSFKVYFTHIHI